MKVKEFIQMNEDIDVYNNVTDEWGICACCPIVLTEEGEKEWADVLDMDIEYRPQLCEAVVDVDGEEGVWQRRHNRARKFFFAAAGYCSEADYDLWFIDPFSDEEV